ncbi:J domain-containing protein [Leptolyngbya sp. KIOST-1]|uniref:J domain-containing protein n=1 Tax=Leptolyngbya sp. KIOST-1 TaxID=1229172 RepID=UPI00055C821B|nr:J domain-containing protein [Leptolyngbya sp. KIOST-1]
MKKLNYYEILGVEKNASIDEIKQAYRKKAFECHPDHGGTVTEMQIVNEAWEILSDPHARVVYDREQTNPNDQEAQRENRQNRARAQQKAAEYPKSWEAFEKYLNNLLNDIRNAEYQTEYVTLKGIRIGLPTSSNSYSAQLFMGVGGVLGLIFMLFLFGFFAPGSLFITVASGFAIAGAWVGYFLHKILKNEL